MKKQDTNQISTWYEKKSKRKFSSGGSGSKAKKGDGAREERFSEKKDSQKKSVQKSFGGYKKNQQKKNAALPDYVTETERLFDLSSVPDDAKKVLSDFQGIINSTHPLNSKQRSLLSDQIRELSHGLTDQRGERRLGYMNQPATLSAYVHYFLWWNLFRLVRLFANLPSNFLALSEKDLCLDIGSGPLTVPLALYISRPELRTKKLRWYCMDISAQSLSIGENLLMTIATKLNGVLWEIVRVKGEFGTEIKEKASFVFCANIFNEIVEDRQMPPDYQAKKITEGILPYINPKCENPKVFLVEPGVPNSARLLSLMRDAFMRRGFNPVSPCPHASACPMDGKKGGKWCNFAFSTDDAPADLKKISEKANLPKERAVLSFVAMEKSPAQKMDEKNLSFRIGSDPIHLPGGRTGYYACSILGLLLVVTDSSLSYGNLLSVPAPKRELPVDEKSGAYILSLDDAKNFSRRTTGTKTFASGAEYF